MEKGVWPGVLNGSRVVNGAAVMTRPHFDYTEVANYNGSSDSSKAGNLNPAIHLRDNT